MKPAGRPARWGRGRKAPLVTKVGHLETLDQRQNRIDPRNGNENDSLNQNQLDRRPEQQTEEKPAWLLVTSLAPSRKSWKESWEVSAKV